jgi:hypothetical protein
MQPILGIIKWVKIMDLLRDLLDHKVDHKEGVQECKEECPLEPWELVVALTNKVAGPFSGVMVHQWVALVGVPWAQRDTT